MSQRHKLPSQQRMPSNSDCQGDSFTSENNSRRRLFFWSRSQACTYDLRVFEEGQMAFSGGEIEAVEDGKEASSYHWEGRRAKHQSAK
jgi:hypothetical protein